MTSNMLNTEALMAPLKAQGLDSEQGWSYSKPRDRVKRRADADDLCSRDRLIASVTNLEDRGHRIGWNDWQAAIKVVCRGVSVVKQS